MRVILETTDTETIPWMTIDNFPASGQAIASGSASGASNEQRIEDVFEAFPGVTYHLEVFPFFAGPPPIPYTVTWEFISRVDCYEPNNAHHRDGGFRNSKRIPFNQTIEAFGIQGYNDNAFLSTETNHFDWYRIEVSQPTTIKLELLQSPSNALVTFTIFDDQGIALTSPNDFIVTQGADSLDPGRLIEYNPITLDPGIYHIVMNFGVSTFDASVRLSDNRAFPDHFDTPYKFRVTTE